MYHIPDFGKIRKKFLGNGNIEEQDEKTISITSQVFKLFLKDKSLVNRAIILDISKDEIVLLLHESSVFLLMF